MKVLLTGGAGFIGSHVADQLLARGHEVAIVDDLSTGKKKNVPEGAIFYERDIRDECAEVCEEFEPDALCHQAAQTDVRRSVREPGFDADVNVLGTIRLLQRCVERGVRRVVFASTGGAVYGEARVVAIFCRNLVASRGSTINGAGEQTRDYVFVEDVARANVLALEGHAPSGAYNVGTGIETSVNELYEILRETSGRELPPTHGAAKPGEQLRSSVDPTTAARVLGWRPETDLTIGLKHTLSFFQAL